MFMSSPFEVEVGNYCGRFRCGRQIETETMGQGASSRPLPYWGQPNGFRRNERGYVRAIGVGAERFEAITLTQS